MNNPEYALVPIDSKADPEEKEEKPVEQENKSKVPRKTKVDDKTEQEKRLWKTKYDDSTIRIRLDKNLYNKLMSIKEINSTQKMSLNKIINKLYDNFIERNPQYAPTPEELNEAMKASKAEKKD